MLKNRAFRIQMVKTPEQCSASDKDTVNRYPSIEYLKQTAILVGAGYAAKAVVDTGCELVLLIAKSKLR